MWGLLTEEGLRYFYGVLLYIPAMWLITITLETDSNKGISKDYNPLHLIVPANKNKLDVLGR